MPKSLWDPCYAAWGDIMRPLEVEHQMAIPLTLHGHCHRAFVLVTCGTDFSDDDLTLARRLQALLIGLDRQAQALERWMPRAPSHEASLTNREVAVLGLVADGLTARAIARRLLISPRTVQKHLEHVYAKLRATDKVSAVLKAQSLGLLGGHAGRFGSVAAR
ncbi:response regulator transcription factor [Lentzea flaviverrucosa]|uniref:response regulator transcription factor n=1 Tax=Lentzea flaviverrucosa TaxID=200379 RepID=UPI001FE9A662|nr:LuxR C-terminal-related transcriptional regulator [Lentzea flaviverrucosa]